MRMISRRGVSLDPAGTRAFALAAEIREQAYMHGSTREVADVDLVMKDVVEGEIAPEVASKAVVHLAYRTQVCAMG